MTNFARSDKASFEITNSQPGECFNERQKLYLKSKTTTEKTNWPVSVYDETLDLYKNAQITLLLGSDGSGHPSEINLKQFRIIAHSAIDQLKACSDILSCARSKTSGSSLVFPSLTLVREIWLQVAASRTVFPAFQMQFSILRLYPQALSALFRNFHCKIACFHAELQLAAGFLWL